MPKTDRERLKALLKQHSLTYGDFTLTSGRKSHYYFDSKKPHYYPREPTSWRPR